MKKDKPPVKLSLRYPRELHLQLRMLATLSGRSLNSYIARTLAEHVAGRAAKKERR